MKLVEYTSSQLFGYKNQIPFFLPGTKNSLIVCVKTYFAQFFLELSHFVVRCLGFHYVLQRECSYFQSASRVSYNIINTLDIADFRSILRYTGWCKRSCTNRKNCTSCVGPKISNNSRENNKIEKILCISTEIRNSYSTHFSPKLFTEHELEGG